MLLVLVLPVLLCDDEDDEDAAEARDRRYGRGCARKLAPVSAGVLSE